MKFAKCFKILTNLTLQLDNLHRLNNFEITLFVITYYENSSFKTVDNSSNLVLLNEENFVLISLFYQLFDRGVAFEQDALHFTVRYFVIYKAIVFFCSNHSMMTYFETFKNKKKCKLG